MSSLATEPRESGEALIRDLTLAIESNQSVLLVGPRGCGKTYCIEQACLRARRRNLIKGHHTLQGNREIPRDYLSEASWVIRNRPEDGRLLGTRAPLIRRDPSKTFDGESDELLGPNDRAVLFLDEINRFGDGFLDSLLSLFEERIVVVGGERQEVNIVVLASANPPGYDITARRLSPPLQARISRSYWLAQPGVESLVYRILPGQLARSEGTPPPPDDLLLKCAAACLLLWGRPEPERTATAYLTRVTRHRLSRVLGAEVNVALADHVRRFQALVSFGPDARAIKDWITAASKSTATGHVSALLENVVPVLGHKVRSDFNEGFEPDKVLEKNALLEQIVGAALTDPAIWRYFAANWVDLLPALTGCDGDECGGAKSSSLFQFIADQCKSWALSEAQPSSDTTPSSEAQPPSEAHLGSRHAHDVLVRCLEALAWHIRSDHCVYEGANAGDSVPRATSAIHARPTVGLRGDELIAHMAVAGALAQGARVASGFEKAAQDEVVEYFDRFSDKGWLGQDVVQRREGVLTVRLDVPTAAVTRALNHVPLLDSLPHWMGALDEWRPAVDRALQTMGRDARKAGRAGRGRDAPAPGASPYSVAFFLLLLELLLRALGDGRVLDPDFPGVGELVEAQLGALLSPGAFVAESVAAHIDAAFVGEALDRALGACARQASRADRRAIERQRAHVKALTSHLLRESAPATETSDARAEAETVSP